jgi:hypothetical protein
MYFIKNIYACINKMCILLIKDNKWSYYYIINYWIVLLLYYLFKCKP